VFTSTCKPVLQAQSKYEASVPERSRELEPAITARPSDALLDSVLEFDGVWQEIPATDSVAFVATARARARRITFQVLNRDKHSPSPEFMCLASEKSEVFFVFPSLATDLTKAGRGEIAQLVRTLSSLFPNPYDLDRAWELVHSSKLLKMRAVDIWKKPFVGGGRMRRISRFRTVESWMEPSQGFRHGIEVGEGGLDLDAAAELWVSVKTLVRRTAWRASFRAGLLFAAFAGVAYLVYRWLWRNQFIGVTIPMKEIVDYGGAGLVVVLAAFWLFGRRAWLRVVAFLLAGGAAVAYGLYWLLWRTRLASRSCPKSIVIEIGALLVFLFILRFVCRFAAWFGLRRVDRRDENQLQKRLSAMV
jgi:hypothetical protein